MTTSIRLLSPTTINRIAAGEVIERPASAVKELVENAIDASATQIDIFLNNAGCNLIQVTDNGHGMSSEELTIAVERHATSKLKEDDLLNIAYFGFRGEALPSMASVSRMTITSRTRESEHAWSITINGGEKEEPAPASQTVGTKIEIRDLFFSTPARLKFLKSERTELQYTIDIINKLAIAHPEIGFSLETHKKPLFSLPPSTLLERINMVMGEEFASNSLKLHLEDQNFSISGYTSLPTFHRNTSSELYLFVNNRPVKDRLLIAASKIAYHDFMPRDRYPVLVLFLNIPYEQVDVNVHPTKAEVRFRDSDLVRNMIIRTIKEALAKGSHRTSSTIATKAINSFVPSVKTDTDKNKLYALLKLNEQAKNYQTPTTTPSYQSTSNSTLSLDQSFVKEPIFTYQPSSIVTKANNISAAPSQELHNIQVDSINTTNSVDLGNAKCQLSSTYIIAEKEDGIVIIDQHAAHERLIYEKLKISYTQGKILKQRLLVPEIIDLNPKIIVLFDHVRNNLATLGLVYDICGDKTIMVSEIPLLLKTVDVKNLIKDIGDELLEYGSDLSLNATTEHILETFACHHSIRAGRKLSIDEMNSLLREMENTPHSGQCNHGRPTYIELNFKSIEKLFGRS